MARPIHGMRHTRFYNIWMSAKQRCLNPNAKDYPRYGGRGLAFAEEWREFVTFMNDMLPAYRTHAALHGEANTQIDRIDNSLGYIPGNCRWVTARENLNNRDRYAKVGTNGRKTNWGKHGRE